MADAMTPESALAVTTIYRPLSESEKAAARRMVGRHVPKPNRAEVESMLGISA